MEKKSNYPKVLKMQDRQRVLRNAVAFLGVGKAAVIGAGMALALVGYVDIASNVLPDAMVDLAVNGLSAEAAASVGGVIGAAVSLAVGLFR
jgi:hypothetical protein